MTLSLFCIILNNLNSVKLIREGDRNGFHIVFYAVFLICIVVVSVSSLYYNIKRIMLVIAYGNDSFKDNMLIKGLLFMSLNVPINPRRDFKHTGLSHRRC